MRIYEDLDYAYVYLVDPYVAPEIIERGDDFVFGYKASLTVYLKYLNAEANAWEFDKLHSKRRQRKAMGKKLKTMVETHAEYFVWLLI